MGTRSKGNKRERQAREIYERAGFVVEKASPERYGRSDWYSHWDGMAVRSDAIHMFQVKSTNAEGIYGAAEWAAENAPSCMECEYAVYHANEGWRLLRIIPEDESYTCVYDERKDDDVDSNYPDKLNMGEGLTRFLER